MTPQQEAAREGIDLDAATERVQGILRDKQSAAMPSAIHAFTMPEIPAAVQEAGDKAWAELAENYTEHSTPGMPGVARVAKRAPRSDKGTKRPKPVPAPEPAPEPKQQAGGITAEEADHLNGLFDLEFRAREEYGDAEARLRAATHERVAFIASLRRRIDALAK